jgi:hypothetical protein
MDRSTFSKLALAACLALVPAVLCGCMSYVTPARGVSMQSLAQADSDIRERMTRQPASEFPARIAVSRVQANGYRSYRHDGYGSGNFSVVTGRDMEQEASLQRLERLPMVAAVVPLNRLVVPAELKSDRELRLAAASLKADLLLTYSFDTTYRIDGRDIGPLGLITLGFLPVNDARVTSTASAAIFDVRTGYVYGLSEATQTATSLASAWSSQDAVDDNRVKAEQKAFDQLMSQVEGVWKQVVERHAGPSTAALARD